MNDITRLSSRTHQLDRAFLAERLNGAKSYSRIAGYFRSSIFELVGEELAGVEKVRIVCNSELDSADILVSRRVRAAQLLEKWNETIPELDALCERERYRRLYDLLTAGNVEVRVVPREKVFVHGKAGVIEASDGSKTCFIGSVNETRSGFQDHYEILWEDRSQEGILWVEAEFEELWRDAVELPDCIINEIRRVAEREQVLLAEVNSIDLPGAALAEAPIYRCGEQLQPWQRSFVTTFIREREIYGKARLLLADEVGVGKTLSLAASAMMSVLLGDGPVLILCPSTLTQQWQAELLDKLAIPSAVWRVHKGKKVWVDHLDHVINTRGAEDVARCPYRIGIVSTGLVIHGAAECEHLLAGRYGMVILDEAHKARRRGVVGAGSGEPNNLLQFMGKIAGRTRHLLLATATPIQTEVKELWDLFSILNSGVGHVLGKEGSASCWSDCDRSLPVVKGEETICDPRAAWEWLANPLPPAADAAEFRLLREQLEMADDRYYCNMEYSQLSPLAQMNVEAATSSSFFKEHNPFVRHTVFRQRRKLEDAGLLERVGVNLHPAVDGPAGQYRGVVFSGLGLPTNTPFELAYQAAEQFTKALAARGSKGGGFMKTMLLQRICSSFAAGKATAERMMGNAAFDDETCDEDDLSEETIAGLGEITKDAGLKVHLQTIIDELGRAEAHDPKVAAVKFFLCEHRTDGKTWLEHGCIVFSQYYDTVYSLANELSTSLPGDKVAIYAGLGRSGIFINGEFVAVAREKIKSMVKERQLKLVVATDAACEGLNLQTLGTLINVDLPWNPSRLEQRLGRIKRFGQTRRNVDMLNLVYHETQDEKIYTVLSRRMKDRFDIFGSLPDIIIDEWIKDAEDYEEEVDRCLHLRAAAKSGFELRAGDTGGPDENRWDLCNKVLARSNVSAILSEPW